MVFCSHENVIQMEFCIHPMKHTIVFSKLQDIIEWIADPSPLFPWEKNRDYPAIINVNIGTTVKGAVDDLDRIIAILEDLNIPRERFHIHCDGALFALMSPFVDSAPEISFQKPIDSIAVSGHKMLGCPMPCGVALSRKEHVEKVEQHIDYLNSVDTTIMGSRNGQAALYMWYSLRKKGIFGIKKDVM